jgi:hypothetical protein
MQVTDSVHNASGDGAVVISPAKRMRLCMYLAPLVLTPLTILVAAIFIVPTDWFAMRSHSDYILTAGYGSQLHNADCAVTIYGDSTAMVGVNPKQIAERTGLSTCNVAEVVGMTMLFDTMVLDQFLARNPRPRFIVFLFAPENFDPQSQRNNPEMSKFEAIRYRFKQPQKLLGVMQLMRHPEDFFLWSERGIRMAVGEIFTKPFPPETRVIRFKSLGQLQLKEPDLVSCSPHSLAVEPDKQWVQSLRSEYSGEGTTVLVDAMPLPTCDPDLAYFQRTLSGVIDNRLGSLPAADYYSGASSVGRHANAHGSVPLSNMIADQILDRLHSSSTIGAH